MTTIRPVLLALVLLAGSLAGCVGSEDASPDPPPTDADPPPSSDTAVSENDTDPEDPADGNRTAENATAPDPVTREWSDDALAGIPLVGDPKEEAVRRSYANQGTLNGTFVVFYDVRVPEGFATLEGNLSAPPTDPVGVWPDYDLYVLDPDGTIVDGNTDVGTREEVSVDDPAAGTWTFVAWYAVGEAVEGAVTEAFTLQVVAVPDGTGSGP